MPIEYKSLKAKQRELRAQFSEALRLRVHRAISWLGRAESEKDDLDVKFILLWIAFNAAYADEITYEDSERSAFKSFFTALVSLDNDSKIYNAVWARFPQEIRLFLSNKHVYAPFWRFHNGDISCENWEERMRRELVKINQAVAKKETAEILTILCDRLYVLRNQLIHGGATWNSKINRTQVKDGAAILSYLVPIFVDIMLENPKHDWGKPFYGMVE